MSDHPAPRPNILFIHSDQHRFDCVGVNGHPLIPTPNLDRMAAEGVNFTQAYTPVPVCTPARTSLLTGQWPTEHLCIANWRSEAPRPAVDGLPTFSQTLNEHGYFLGYIGDLCGGHGMMDKHFIMYDDVVRVPLIARWPARIAPGGRCDAFVSSAIDLAATFCDVTGAPVPETFSGQSLAPLLAGVEENGRPDILSMYHGNVFGLYSQRMVRDRRWKYVWNATAEDELYDLARIALQIHNRATDPVCAGELARLRRRLVAWMEETHDLLLNPWTRDQLLMGLKV